MKVWNYRKYFSKDGMLKKDIVIVCLLLLFLIGGEYLSVILALYFLPITGERLALIITDGIIIFYGGVILAILFLVYFRTENK
jgi:hypothetical protein